MHLVSGSNKLVEPVHTCQVVPLTLTTCRLPCGDFRLAAPLSELFHCTGEVFRIHGDPSGSQDVRD